MVVGKSDFKENPKSDLDLDQRFVKNFSHRRNPFPPLQKKKFILFYFYFVEFQSSFDVFFSWLNLAFISFHISILPIIVLSHLYFVLLYICIQSFRILLLWCFILPSYSKPNPAGLRWFHNLRIQLANHTSVKV